MSTRSDLSNAVDPAVPSPDTTVNGPAPASPVWPQAEALGSGSRLRVESIRSHGVGPVDLSLDRAECVCVSGPSGAGKTLLLRALADLDPHEGEALLDGKPLGAFAGPEWRRQVGLLPPESAWWHDGVGAHFPLEDKELLLALALPPEIMGWSIARLSSGERQRLALIRLLANRPRVLLLDEPTANLDPASVERVEALLFRYRQQTGAAILWVSHDPAQIVRVASRHLRLQGGRLVEAQP